MTLTAADWFNDVNRLHYTIFVDPSNAAAVSAALKPSMFLTPYSVGMMQVKRKTADESLTTNTVLQDDDHLTFTIAASEEWVAEFKVDAGSLIVNTGFKVAITVPSGATLNAVAAALLDDSTFITSRTTTSGAVVISRSAAIGPNSTFLTVRVWVVNGATPGSVTLQWAQFTSSGSALTFRKGSYMVATRVA